MTPEEILKRAADVIRERGLNQNGYYFAHNGACCTLGAIKLVSDDLAERSGAYRLVRERAGITGIPYWNDNATLDEVLAVLDPESASRVEVK